ncbi:hypothetical protein [Paenibacillus elgii]|uniref:hypothetical protein n=1 Tax=Paenibacillus elgii TaxID=189691 RepID=UPI000248C2EF|nr:hypothetical protein [Paenibacillus elgii]
MDVLNTYGGVVEPGNIAAGILFAIMAAGLLVLAYLELAKAYQGSAVVSIALAVLYAVLYVWAITDKSPIRYEVTLREGAVIDATKYEVVERRGKIYVIQERRSTE